MATAKRKASAKAETARPVATAATPVPITRVAVARPDDALAATLALEVATLADRATLTAKAQALASGKLPPQAALLELARAASRAIDAAAETAQRAAARQALISNALRDDLLRLRSGVAPPRPGKNDFLLRGRVALASGEPAPGLAVEALDAKSPRQDALGAAVTDDGGDFQIRFAAKSFAEYGETGPELALSVGVEGEDALHATAPARLFAAGHEARVDIVLPDSANATVGAVAARRGRDTDDRLFRVEYARALAQAQQQQFGGLAEALRSGLTRLIEGLQRQ